MQSRNRESKALSIPSFLFSDKTSGSDSQGKSLRNRLWPALILSDIFGFVVVVWLLPLPFIPLLRLHVFLAVVLFITTCLVSFPIIRFLDTGWLIRYNEFRNKLPDGRLRVYLGRFWRLRVTGVTGLPASAVNPSDMLTLDQANKLFATIYEEQYGRGAFVTPLALLVVTVFLETAMVVLVECGVLNLGIVQNDNIRTGVAAIAGAYLFVVGDAVARIRWRSLNIADIYNYALRMVLAVPIGTTISTAAAPALGALVAFSVAGLPLAELAKLLQRLASKNVNQTAPEEANDQLIVLEGVTRAIAADLEAEGVSSVDQLLCSDPVLLAIRTGLPFDLILRLASQAITGRYLTGHAAGLLPLGLGDAPAIAALVAGLDSQCVTQKTAAYKILEDASGCLRSKDQPGSPSPDLIEFQFRRIAEDSYTQIFLIVDQDQLPSGFLRAPPANRA